MKHLILVTALLLLTFGCSEESQNEDLDLNLEIVTNTRGLKVDVCHRHGNDTWKIININSSAVQTHLAHGDVLLEDNDGDGFVSGLNECLPGGDCDDNDATTYPGAEEICGDGIDNNCDGQIDENCCPYFSVNDILAIASEINYFNQFGDGCLLEDSVIFFSNFCNLGLSYDVGIYGDTVIIDTNCMFNFGDSIATLNICEDVLLAAQAILNAPSACGDGVNSGTIYKANKGGLLLAN